MVPGVERVIGEPALLAMRAGSPPPQKVPCPDIGWPSSKRAMFASSDIVTCATTSTAPIVRGAWLKPGAHVDLAGAFKPSMRETDGDVVARASVYVDTRDGALAEAGDLLQARDEGKFDFAAVKGDLADLTRGRAKGRTSADEITLFKSCGTAIEDLATAIMVYQKAT